MSTDAELDYLEKLFGDAYRREIEQEENVWRTLPFFAATLALQLAGLAQVRDWVVVQAGGLLWLSLGLLAAAGLATVAALLFLAESIWPMRYLYVAPETDTQVYLGHVREGRVADGDEVERAVVKAVRAVRAVMVQHYALGVVHNRRLNQRRANRRTRAGLATLGSVLAMLALVGIAVVSNLHGHG